MNVILILVDSLNRWALETYGGNTVQAPNLSALANRGVTFCGHYAGSMPCMPARRELFSGRQEFPWRGWGPLEPFDNPLPRVAAEHGAATMIVTDHYHYWETDAHGYLQSFQGAELIRGHELDFWKTQPEPNLPQWAKAIEKWRPGWANRYYQNVAGFRDEADFFSPRVMSTAAQWLEENHTHPKFFLQIESFDVHEPFHVPEPYRSMYTDDLDPEFTCWPPYQDAKTRERFFAETSERELNYIRAQYKGKVTMMDRWLGNVWSVMDRHRLWDNTMVIVTADHGHDLGERPAFGKGYPHHDNHANIPLIVWHPEYANHSRRIDALTSTVDLYATVLEALGITDAPLVHSRSVMPLLDGRADHIRDWCFYGRHGTGACCTDGEHVLLRGTAGGVPLFHYTSLMLRPEPEATAGRFIPGVDCPVWRMPRGDSQPLPTYLMKRGEPAGTLYDLSGTEPALARHMHDLLRKAVNEVGAPPEFHEMLGLTP